MKARVPKLRFPEFRGTRPWIAAPLGEICSLRAGRFVSADDISATDANDLYPCYGGNGRRGYTRTFTHDGTYPLIGRQGELCGNVAIVSGRFHATEHAVVATPVVSIDPKWLYYELCTLRLSQYSTGQAQPGLSVATLDKVATASPTQPEEQQKIADCLSSLDDLIAAHADKLAALKQHKQGLLEQLFPCEGETVPRLRFPEFRRAPDWQPTTVGAVCAVLQGYGFPLTLQGKRSGRYPFCKVSDISRAFDDCGGLLCTAANYVDDADVATLRAATLPVGSTVFAKIGEALRLNRRALTTVACLVDNNATGLKMKASLGSDYFLFVLSQRIDMNQYCGGAVPSISKSTLENIPITVPKPDEQQRIADAFASVDTLITAQSDRLAALKQHKQGLLQQLFPVMDETAP